MFNKDELVIGIDVGSKNGDCTVVSGMCSNCNHILFTEAYDNKYFSYTRPSHCKFCGQKLNKLIELR